MSHGEDQHARIARLLGLDGQSVVSIGDLLEAIEVHLEKPVEITETMRGMASVVLAAQTMDGFYSAARLLAIEVLGEDDREAEEPVTTGS